MRPAVLLCSLALGCGSSESSDAVREDGGAGGTLDASSATTRDARAQTRSDGGGGSTNNKGDPSCGKAEVTTQRVVPRVWLLIDGSGSMLAPLGFGGASRFEVLRSALLDPDKGLVSKLQDAVAFGLMIYDGGASPPGVYIPGICPRVIVVEPAIDNYRAINDAYPVLPPGASTPTHYALLDLQARIQAATSADPSFVLLATDGKPNLCDFHDGIPATFITDQQAVDTVAELKQAGTQTFALSMAGDDADLQTHLQDVARAGGTGSNVFSPANQDDLVKALTEIFGGTQSCTIAVDGTVVAGKECSGDVTLNGQALQCETDYRVGADKKSIELLGEACKKLRGEPASKLSASFACNDVVLL